MSIEMIAGKTILKLHGMHFPCVIGVHAWENQQRHVVVHLDIELRDDCAAEARGSDVLESTLDYTAVEYRIASLLQSRSFKLLETMADAIARDVLFEAPVKRVRVEIEKPGALRFAPMVAIVHEVSRP